MIFTFDNNTDVRTSAVNYKAKITPPRIKPPGTKVGCLSTRTPHRPNNVGLSLLKLHKVEGSTITVTGVDLCDKTPIYDIKPFVPWDVPGYVSGGNWGGEVRVLPRVPLPWSIPYLLPPSPIYPHPPSLLLPPSQFSQMLDVLRCPEWVWDPCAASELSSSSRPKHTPPSALPSTSASTVKWTESAEEDLAFLVSRGVFAPLYPKKVRTHDMGGLTAP